MGVWFYLEVDLGNIVDEYGNDSMDITENKELFKLEELSSYSTFVALRAKLVDTVGRCCKSVKKRCRRVFISNHLAQNKKSH